MVGSRRTFRDGQTDGQDWQTELILEDPSVGPTFLALIGHVVGPAKIVSAFWPPIANTTHNSLPLYKIYINGLHLQCFGKACETNERHMLSKVHTKFKGVTIFYEHRELDLIRRKAIFSSHEKKSQRQCFSAKMAWNPRPLHWIIGCFQMMLLLYTYFNWKIL